MDFVDFLIAEESFGQVYCFNCGELLLSYADESELAEDTAYSIYCPKCGEENIINT